MGLDRQNYYDIITPSGKTLGMFYIIDSSTVAEPLNNNRSIIKKTDDSKSIIEVIFYANFSTYG